MQQADPTGAAVLLALLVPVLIWGFWQWKRMQDVRRWPKTEATIESASLEVVRSSKYQDIQLPTFAFSYQVNGEYFSGRFALMPYITDPGPSLMERMIGRKLQVHYNPRDPNECFVPVDLMEGCKVKQKTGVHFTRLYLRD